MTLTLVKKTNKYQPKVDCKAGYFTKGWSQGPTYKDKAACTNTPMNCEHCKEIHWKYGLQSHYETKHGDKPKPVTLGPKEAKYMKNIG